MIMEAQAAPEAGAASDDVHADVRAAMEQLSEPVQEAPEAETAKADRNERGQFTQKAGDEPAETVSDADPSKANVEQPSKVVDAPAGWSADAKAEFGKLSPVVQAAVLKRESEINEGGSRWSEEKKGYEETLTPLRAVAQKHGLDEKTGLKRLLIAQDYLERDPANAIAWLANAYGVNLSNDPSNQSQRPQADPMFARLSQEVSSLKSSLEQREQAEVNTTLQSFASAPGHEHFEAVKVKMGHLINAGQANDLQDAYDQAVWANPDTRKALLAAQTAEAAKNGRDKATVEKARRGAISVNGSPSSTAAQQPKRDYETVEDAVRAAYAQHAG